MHFDFSLVGELRMLLCCHRLVVGIIMIKVVSCNLNGIRAAKRKGFFEWMEEKKPDVVCLQETKADQSIMASGAFDIPGYHLAYHSAEKKGYSGVAIYSKLKPLKITTTTGHENMDSEGRFIMAEFPSLTIVSLYLPSGTSGDERQAIKMALCEHFYNDYLLPQMEKQKTIICGDWNIAHKEIDLKNAKQNMKNSGFLPEERAWLDQVFDQAGWCDAFRVRNQDPGQYTWWSYRARARENNVGWRIDYQVVSPDLKTAVANVEIVTQPMFSDHAPLVIDYARSLE